MDDILTARFEDFSSLLKLPCLNDNLGRYFTDRAHWTNDGRQWVEDPESEEFSYKKDTKWFGRKYEALVDSVKIERMTDAERDELNSSAHPFFKNFLHKHTSVRSNCNHNSDTRKLSHEWANRIVSEDKWDSLHMSHQLFSEIPAPLLPQNTWPVDFGEYGKGQLKVIGLRIIGMKDLLLNNGVDKVMFQVSGQFDENSFVVLEFTQKWVGGDNQLEEDEDDEDEEEGEGEDEGEGEGEQEKVEDEEGADNEGNEEGGGEEEEEEEEEEDGGDFEPPSPSYYLVGMIFSPAKLGFLYSIGWDFQGYEYNDLDEHCDEFGLVVKRLLNKVEGAGKEKMVDEEEEEEEEEDAEEKEMDDVPMDGKKEEGGGQEGAVLDKEAIKERMRSHIMSMMVPPRRTIDRLSRLNVPHPNSDPSQPPNQHCRNCGKKENLKACEKCKVVCYCSENCANHHWEAQHKVDCERLREEDQEGDGEGGGGCSIM